MQSKVNDNIQIIIDPGHGGSETGAVANGYKEKDLNLTVSLELRKILQGYFSKVLMTRETDVYFDLNERAAWMAQKAAVFSGRTIGLSIHENAFNGQARGTEVIYSVHSTTDLSKCITDKIAELGVPRRNPNMYTKSSSKGADIDYFGIIRNSGKAQIVIIESLFIDNASDAQFLKQADFLKNLARKIAEGLLEYLKIPQEQSKPETPKQHWAKADNDELMKDGILLSDHTSTLDNPATEGFVLSMLNRIRKDNK